MYLLSSLDKLRLLVADTARHAVRLFGDLLDLSRASFGGAGVAGGAPTGAGGGSRDDLAPKKGALAIGRFPAREGGGGGRYIQDLSLHNSSGDEYLH